MIYVNCCLRYEYESDLRSNKHHLSSANMGLTLAMVLITSWNMYSFNSPKLQFQ